MNTYLCKWTKKRHSHLDHINRQFIMLFTWNSILQWSPTLCISHTSHTSYQCHTHKHTHTYEQQKPNTEHETQNWEETIIIIIICLCFVSRRVHHLPSRICHFQYCLQTVSIGKNVIRPFLNGFGHVNLLLDRLFWVSVILCRMNWLRAATIRLKTIPIHYTICIYAAISTLPYNSLASFSVFFFLLYSFVCCFLLSISAIRHRMTK